MLFLFNTKFILFRTQHAAYFFYQTLHCASIISLSVHIALNCLLVSLQRKKEAACLHVWGREIFCMALREHQISLNNAEVILGACRSDIKPGVDGTLFYLLRSHPHKDHGSHDISHLVLMTAWKPDRWDPSRSEIASGTRGRDCSFSQLLACSRLPARVLLSACLLLPMPPSEEVHGWVACRVYVCLEACMELLPRLPILSRCRASVPSALVLGLCTPAGGAREFRSFWHLIPVNVSF